MSTNVGWATLTIIPSAKGFSAALSSQVSGQLTSVGTDGGHKAGSAFGSAFKAIMASQLVTGAVEGIKRLVSESITAASDLEQSFGSVNAIFAENSAQIQQWSSNASKSVGLSKSKYNELATLLGAQLRNTGTPMDELAGRTNDLIVLGADLAATYNTTVEEAVRAISATFRGERDPIEKYGITLRQQEIDAAAASLGYEKVKGKLDAQGNAAGTLKLLLEQASVAQGMFNKEQDTYAVKVQQAKAGWHDLKAAIGELFMPALKGALDVINGVVQPLARMADALADARNRGEDVKLTFEGVAKALEGTPLGDFLGQLQEKMGPLAPLVERVKDAFEPIGPAIQRLRDLFPTFNPLLGLAVELFSLLAEPLADIAVSLARGILDALNRIYAPMEAFLNLIADSTKNNLPTFAEIIERVASFFGTLVSVCGQLVAIAAEVVTKIAMELEPVFSTFARDTLPPLIGGFENLLGFIQPVAEFIGDVLVAAVEAVSPVLQRFVDEFLTPLAQKFEEATEKSGPLRQNFEDMLTFVKDLLQPILDLAQAMGGTLLDAMSGLDEPTRRISDALGGTLRDALPDIQNFVESICKTIEDKILPWVTPIVNFLADVVAYACEQFAPVAKDFTENTLPALAEAFDAIATALGPLLEELLPELGAFFVNAIPQIAQVVGALMNLVAVLAYWLAGAIKIVTGLLQGDWPTVMQGWEDITKGTTLAMETEFYDFKDSVVTNVNDAGDESKKSWDEHLSGMEDTTRYSFGGMDEETKDRFDNIGGTIKSEGASASEEWGVCMAGMEEETSDASEDVAITLKGVGEDAAKNLNVDEETLKPSGKSLISGFVDGILATIEEKHPIIGGALQKIKDFFPNSPAKRGPFSGRGYTLYSGQKTIQDFANGMLSQMGAASSAAEAVTGAASAAFGNVSGAPLATALATSMAKATDSDTWAAMGETVAEGVATISSTLATGMTAVNTDWTAQWQQVATTLGIDWSQMQNTTTTAMQLLVEFLNTTMTNLQAFLTNTLNAIRAFWQDTWNAMQAHVNNLWPVLQEFVLSQLTAMQANITSLMTQIKDFWNVTWTEMHDHTSATTANICSNVASAMGNLLYNISNHMSTIQGVWTVGWNAVRNVCADAWNQATAACRDGMNNVITVIRELPGNIRGAIGNVGDELKASGESLMNGFIEGIRAAGNRVGDAVARSINNSTDGLNLGSVVMDSMANDALSAVAAISPMMVSAAREAANASYDALEFGTPTVAAPKVRDGGVMGQLGSANSQQQPLVGQLTFQSSGNTRDDVNEAMFQLRRIQRGGAHA